MPEKTIRLVYYAYTDEDGVPQMADRGETVDLPEKEVERGDKLGAFEDSPEAETMDALTAAYGITPTDPESGVDTAPPPPVSDEAKEPVELEIEGEEGEQPDPTGEGYPELADDTPETEEGEPVGEQQPAHQVEAEPAQRKGRKAQAQPVQDQPQG